MGEEEKTNQPEKRENSSISQSERLQERGSESDKCKRRYVSQKIHSPYKERDCGEIVKQTEQDE